MIPRGNEHMEHRVGETVYASARYTYTVAAGVVPSAELSERFPIASVRIDNFTSQWLLVAPLYDFVRPFSLGVIFNVRGLGRLTVEPIRPAPTLTGPSGGAPPFVEPDVINGQSYYVTLFEKPQIAAPEGRRIAADDMLYDAGGVARTIGTAFVTTDATWRISTISMFYRSTATPGTRSPSIAFLVPGTFHPLYVYTLPDDLGPSGSMGISGGAGVPADYPPAYVEQTFSPANPGASSLTFPLGAGYNYRLLSTRFTFTTTATAGNRLVMVQHIDAGGNVLSESYTATQAASITDIYSFGIGMVANAQAGHIAGPLPDMALPAGGSIRILDPGNIDPLDRVTGVQLAFETRPNFTAVPLTGFAPLPLPSPMICPAGTLISPSDAANIDGNDTIEMYIGGVRG